MPQAAIAFSKAAVSSVSPSPTAPKSRTLRHAARKTRGHGDVLRFRAGRPLRLFDPVVVGKFTPALTVARRNFEADMGLHAVARVFGRDRRF